MNIKWSHYSGDNPILCETSWIEPQPFIKYVSKHRSSDFLKCPAFHDFYKNTFVILCPFDFSLKFFNGELKIHSKAEFIRENSSLFFIDRSCQNKNFKMLSFQLMYCFFSEDSCLLETLHPSLCEHLCPSLRDISFISGTFDISKWARPVEFAFELTSKSAELEFKRNDPLFLVKFKPCNNTRVSLERLEYSKDIDVPVKACLSTKALTPNNSMDQNYKMAQHTMNSLKRKFFKKCPFNFLKR